MFSFLTKLKSDMKTAIDYQPITAYLGIKNRIIFLPLKPLAMPDCY